MEQLPNSLPSFQLQTTGRTEDWEQEVPERHCTTFSKQPHTRLVLLETALLLGNLLLGNLLLGSLLLGSLLLGSLLLGSLLLGSLLLGSLLLGSLLLGNLLLGSLLLGSLLLGSLLLGNLLLGIEWEPNALALKWSKVASAESIAHCQRFSRLWAESEEVQPHSSICKTASVK